MMLWGKGKRFGTKSLPQTNPDPATDHGGGAADGGSPTLVNFSEYLRKQLVVSKHLFNASQGWMNEDNPISQKDSQQLIKTLTTKKTSKDSLTGGMNKSSSKKKNKNKKSKDRHSSPQRPVVVVGNPHEGGGGGGKLSIQTPWENRRPRPAPLSEPLSPTTPFMESQPMSRPFSPAGGGAGGTSGGGYGNVSDDDGIRQEDGGEDEEVEENYYDSDHIEDHSPIKIKPIKATKKKIYTNQYIAESDTPGPGSYNIATSLIKPSFNRVFVEPPPATTTNHPSSAFTYSPPNYLRQTTASLFRSYDAPCNHVEDKHSIAWESPTKQTMMYSMQAFKASKSQGRSSHRAHSAPMSRSHGSPFNRQYPPLSDNVIHRWSSEAEFSYARGLRSPSDVRGKVKQNVLSF
eukprot:scaffold1508_cov182-Ochromonas_danica.AAC.3